MDNYKKEFSRWFMLVIGLLIISTIIFTGLNYLGILGNTVVERKVFENSYQYSAGQKDKEAMLQSQKAMIQSKLRSTVIKEEEKAILQSQLDGIEVQLNALERRN